MVQSFLARLALAFEIFAVSASASWPTQAFKTENFHAPRVSVAKYGDTAPGFLFIDPVWAGSNAIAPMIIHEDGQLVWRTVFEELAFNTDAQELNGSPVITYWSGHHNNQGYGCGYGAVTILDNTYTQIHRICGHKLDVHPLSHTGHQCKLDTHESRITSRGTLLATARSVIPADLTSVGGPKDGWVLDSVFYEIDVATEKVLLRWSTYEHRHQFPALKLSQYPLEMPDQNGYFGRTREWPWDFAHMNSVAEVPFPGEGYIVSCRYLWSAIKLDKLGNVEWYLEGSNGGDFTLPRSGNFSYQHDVLAAEVTSESMNLHMFDNANNNHNQPKRPSSGLLLHLNLVNKTVTTLQRFSPRNETISTHTGSYQALSQNRHVLVDFGHPPILNEFDRYGKVVWEASVGPLQGGTYRAYKKPWAGYPKTNPKAVAQYTGSSTSVWASWNGATEVHRWEIHGRQHANDSMKFIKEIPKAGFETLINLDRKYSQVLVRAVHENGTALGKSEMANVQQASSAASSLPSHSNLLALIVAFVAAFLG